MTSPVSRFDRWAESGPFVVADLAVYRIIYALGMLMILPRVTPLSVLPDVFLSAPPGPFRLLHSVPSHSTLLVFEGVLMLVLGCLCVGLFTLASSIAVAILVTCALGFGFSFGRIDHTVFLAVTPLVMAFSGWGGALSVDAALRGRRPRVSPPQWPMRLMAMAIGAAFFTAGLQKVQSGWLNIHTRAVEGYALKRQINLDRGWFWTLVDHIPTRFWEVADWSTVALELSLVVFALSWRTFRPALVAVCIFHVSVLLMLNISFWQNVLPYGLFVAWTAIPSVFRRTTVALSVSRARTYVGGALGVIAVAGITYGLRAALETHGLDGVVTVMGAVIGVGYLGSLLLPQAAESQS
jgi:hypothetical protein